MPLDSFQLEVRNAWFRHEQRFFLTGGAALAGFHLHHRSTRDLDLFAAEDVLDDGVAALRVVAAELGASLEAVRTSASFRRFLLGRGSESVVVDLGHDLAPQVHTDKLRFGSIRVDPPEEILINKLCTLLSRAEIRDLVDIIVLSQRGFSIEKAMSMTAQKDGGMSPAQLAWVLSDLEVGDDADPPAGISVTQIRAFLVDLRARLAAMAWPAQSS